MLLRECVKKVIQNNSSYYKHFTEEICFDRESVFLLITFIFKQEKETIELQCVHEIFLITDGYRIELRPSVFV